MSISKMRRIEIPEMYFLRAVAGYRITRHKRNDDIREEWGITDINTVIKAINRDG
jgi:hypothetical protein